MGATRASISLPPEGAPVDPRGRGRQAHTADSFLTETDFDILGHRCKERRDSLAPMPPATPALVRRLLPTMVGTALLITGLVASWRVMGLRDLAVSQERERLTEYLEEQVLTWEEDLIRDLDDTIEAVAQDPFRAPQRQHRLRRKDAWFNALYLWKPPRAAPGGRSRSSCPGRTRSGTSSPSSTARRPIKKASAGHG